MTFKLIIAILYYIFQVYAGIMSISIILSWIPGAYEIRFFRGIRSISDWYLGNFRGKIVIGIVDFTPMIGLLIYGFILSYLGMLI